MNNNQNNEPISWPEGCNPSELHYFSFPFIGKQARIKRIAKTILNNRNNATWRSCWVVDDSLWCEIVLFLNIVTHLSYIKWPNCFFIPSDNASILLGYYGDATLDSDDVLYPLCRLYGISPDSKAGMRIEEAVFVQDCDIGTLWGMISAAWKDSVKSITTDLGN